MTYLYSLTIVNLVIGCWTLIKVFTKSYVSEKAKNVATKEDIQVITEKIEAVRIGYSSKLERNKADLQQLVLKNNHYLQRNTDTLLKFYDNILSFNFDLLNRSFGDFDSKDNYIEIVSHQKAIDRLSTELKIDYHRIIIFMQGEQEIMDTSMRIIECMLEIQTVFKGHILKIKLALANEGEAFGSPDNDYRLAVEHSNKVVREYYNELAPNRKKLDLLVGEFIGLLMTYLKKRNVIDHVSNE